MFNDELKENTKNIVKEKNEQDKDELAKLDRAMLMEEEISKVFMKYDATVDEAFTVSIALAQTLYLYGMFGDTYSDIDK